MQRNAFKLDLPGPGIDLEFADMNLGIGRQPSGNRAAHRCRGNKPIGERTHPDHGGAGEQCDFDGLKAHWSFPRLIFKSFLLLFIQKKKTSFLKKSSKKLYQFRFCPALLTESASQFH